MTVKLFMGAIKDALKIVEKTPEEIEAIKQEIKKVGDRSTIPNFDRYGFYQATHLTLKFS